MGHVLVFSFIQRFFPDFFPSTYTDRRQNLLKMYTEVDKKVNKPASGRFFALYTPVVVVILVWCVVKGMIAIIPALDMLGRFLCRSNGRFMLLYLSISDFPRLHQSYLPSPAELDVPNRRE